VYSVVACPGLRVEGLGFLGHVTLKGCWLARPRQVLAWGNSMGDLTTNTAMARKGLANMAMTACFAGPLFNLLVGLGLGWAAYLGTSHVAQVSGRTPPPLPPRR
jgi:Sodium/calcium exchanger protein